MDLVWSIANRYYENLPMPSELNSKKQDNRSGKQIIEDLYNKLGGE